MISFTLETTFNASAEKIYKAWLDGKLHTAMTGGEATGTPEENTDFTAWDGYISGTNLELVPNSKIVQAWRTSEFADADESSMLIIFLKDVDNGCHLTLQHTNIPDTQTSDYAKGWEEHYFEPMEQYFG